MATRAKLDGNARYLAKLKTITLRMKPEEHESIKAAAEVATSGSVQGYILQAVRAQMGTAEDDRVHLSISAASLEPYRLEGESAGQTAARLLRLGIQAAKQD